MPKYATLICFEGRLAKQIALHVAETLGNVLNRGTDSQKAQLATYGIHNFSSDFRVHSVSLHDCQQHPLNPRPARVRKNSIRTSKRRYTTPSGGVYYR